MTRCNNCMRIFNSDDDLKLFREWVPEIADFDSFLGCPDCETDGFLMDIDAEEVRKV